MAQRIHRTTLFKIPDPANQQKLLDAYEVLAKEQSKDGKPYILYMSAGSAHSDPRSKGYTVSAKTEFASLEDMKFYDDQCTAHAVLKKTVMTLGITEPPLTIYYTGHPVILVPLESN